VLALSRRRPPHAERQTRILLVAVREEELYLLAVGSSARRVATELHHLARGGGALRVVEDPLAGGRAGARAGGPKGPDCFLIFVLGT
jgi:hypothetical protein